MVIVVILKVNKMKEINNVNEVVGGSVTGDLIDSIKDAFEKINDYLWK